MNCQNCGAPLVLMRERDYYRCEYCGTFYFPSSSPDGVRLLGEDTERIKCSLCGSPLQMATFDDHYRGYLCRGCRGILFNRPTFRQLIEIRRAKAIIPPEPPTIFEQKELQRRVRCPMCSQIMDAHPYLGPGSIIIDTCDQCDLIWLDYHELDKIVNAPGKDRGMPRQEQDETSCEQQNNEQNRDLKKPYGILLDLLKPFFD